MDMTHQSPLPIEFPRKIILVSVAIPFIRGSSNPRIEPTSPELVGRFLITEPPRKPEDIIGGGGGLVAKSCLTRESIDCSLPGSSAHGIFQVRIPEWVSISFSRGSSQPMNRTWVSCIAGRIFTDWAMRESLIRKLLSINKKKEIMPFAVVGPRDKYIKWSKPEKGKYHDITYLWNLKTHTHTHIHTHKQLNLFKNRNRSIDIENKLMLTKGERRGAKGIN